MTRKIPYLARAFVVCGSAMGSHAAVIDASSIAFTDWIEPYPYLSGGNNSGPVLPFTPDPLGQYQWRADVNQSQLQVFFLLPQVVELFGDTPASSFTGYQTLSSSSPNVDVTGAGGLQFDFGVENAAWLEFDSDNLQPADAAVVTMGISEYNEYGIFNTGAKVGNPTAYPRAGTNITTYRFEPNSGLYEGVRFGWLWVNATPATPWTITGFRLVCQIKPTNWGGAFTAAGDDLLSRIWYAGAYTVKVNLLSDQFGSILIYRGDRFSWTGDAHVAQATAMASLGNYDFVKQNLNFTKNNCNGIESYCLYFVLSVVDYYSATADAATVEYLLPYVTSKLEHAHDIWGTSADLGFYGWDDRLGSGFSNATTAEVENAYKFLAIRSWRAWAGVMAAMGNTTAAAHYTAYAANATQTVRSAGPGWWRSFGYFASADAINAGVPVANETSSLISAWFNDSVTGCGLSNFNTFFALEALAAAGELDRGYALSHRCWDVQMLLGATTVWETSQPDWAEVLDPNDGIPGFEDGFTSMAHPWGSGATAWATKWLLGVRPLVQEPGYKRFVVAPHIVGTMAGVRGTVLTTSGPIHLDVQPASADAGEMSVQAVEAVVRLHVPAGTTAVLQLSRVLLGRLGVAMSQAGEAQAVLVSSSLDDEHCQRVSASGWTQAVTGSPEVRGQATELALLLITPTSLGPLDAAQGTAAGTQAAELQLSQGCHTLRLVARNAAAERAALGNPSLAPADGFAGPGSSSQPNPYPPPYYPATFVQRDEITAGSWTGVYGSAGYALFAYDGPNAHVMSLPTFVADIQQAFGHAQNGPWPTNGLDDRALQDPRNLTAPRKIGQYSVPLPWENGWDPSYPMDILLQPWAEGNVTYQFAVYCVDFDGRGRKQSVDLMDRASFNLISPVQFLKDFTGGVWLVWQYDHSVRLRFNYVRGDNQVVSAILFDQVTP